MITDNVCRPAQTVKLTESQIVVFEDDGTKRDGWDG